MAESRGSAHASQVLVTCTEECAGKKNTIAVRAAGSGRPGRRQTLRRGSPVWTVAAIGQYLPTRPADRAKEITTRATQPGTIARRSESAAPSVSRDAVSVACWRRQAHRDR